MPSPRATSDDTPTLLLVGFGPEARASVQRLVARDLEILSVDEAAEGLRRIDEREPAVVCLGAGVRGEDARSFVERARARRPEADTVFLVLAGGPELGRFQDLIDQDALFYLSPEPVVDDDLAAILRSAVLRWWGRRRRRETRGAPPAEETAPAVSS
ncbi:MAG: hypothetical protein PVG07_03780, partial [Acidobacteriota bacterium]